MSNKYTKTGQLSSYYRKRERGPDWVPIQCFICRRKYDESPEVRSCQTTFPPLLHSQMFQNLVKSIKIHDVYNKPIQLSVEKTVKVIQYCSSCRLLVWRLFRLSNSKNRGTKIVEDQINLVKNAILFKFSYGQSSKNSEKLQSLLYFDPLSVDNETYWNIQLVTADCVDSFIKNQEVTEILEKTDYEDINPSKRKKTDHLYLVCPDAESSHNTNKPNSRVESNKLEENDLPSYDEIEIGGKGGAPIHLIKINIGQQFNKNKSQQEGSGEDKRHTRKQVLGSRIGIPDSPTVEVDEMIVEPHIEIHEYDEDVKGFYDIKNFDLERNNRHECSICSKTFDTDKTLSSHLKSHRMEFCSLCRRYYLDKRSLSSHKSVAHDGVNDEVCHLCNESFASPTELLFHLRKHNRDRSYRCSVEGCDADFMTKVECISHTRLCYFSHMSIQ